MAQGKRKEEWIHTTTMAVLIQNRFRGQGEDAVSFAEQYPYRRQRKVSPKAHKAQMADLKEMWLSRAAVDKAAPAAEPTPTPAETPTVEQPPQPRRKRERPKRV